MLVSPADVVAKAKATIKECSVTDARNCVSSGTLLIDIREVAEYNRGHIEGAVLAPRGMLEFEIHTIVERACADTDVSPEDAEIVLYCGTGGRSALAALSLDAMGYRNVRSMSGGLVAWAAAKLPLATPTA
jgi:rhodanese-related sulfurtransferase